MLLKMLIASISLLFLSTQAFCHETNLSPACSTEFLLKNKRFTRDGAWCWFQDPRAVYIEGNKKKTYAGWITSCGQLQVGSYDHETGHIKKVTLKDKWGKNDHNSNSLLALPDNRLITFYTKHNGKGLFCRTTTLPEKISSWEDEVVVSDSKRITYSNPVYLSHEKKIYVFWRGPSWKPTFAYSSDAILWTKPQTQILIQNEHKENSKIRPYLKVFSDGVSAIHFAFTDNHPTVEPDNSIYYLKYKKGNFYKADGTKVSDIDSLPVAHSKSDIVYDAKKTRIRAWIWDIASGHDGFPVIVYALFPEKTDHRYCYARWNGKKWINHEITPAGKWFPQTMVGTKERESFYSGGITLNHSNPSVVYLSRQINGIFEIEKWKTSDNGNTWTSKAITCNSKKLNVRPVVPRGFTDNKDHVLWMSGDYIYYTNYNTEIKMSC